MMFSKKVGAWMRSLGHEYRKVEVMRRALESVDAARFESTSCVNSWRVCVDLSMANK
jgi:hypothetical protein